MILEQSCTKIPLAVRRRAAELIALDRRITRAQAANLADAAAALVKVEGRPVMPSDLTYQVYQWIYQ